MKTKHWLILGILALLVYLFLRRKKSASNSAGSDSGTISTNPTKPGILGDDTGSGSGTTVTTPGTTTTTDIVKTEPGTTGSDNNTFTGGTGTGTGNDVDPPVKPSVISTTASAAAGASKFTPRPVRRSPFFDF